MSSQPFPPEPVSASHAAQLPRRGRGPGSGRGGRTMRQPRRRAPPRTIPDRPVSLRRIARLFAPYRMRLGLLLGLIFLSSILGVASPVPAARSRRQGAPRAQPDSCSLAGGGDDRAGGHQRRDQRRADVDLKPGRPARHARPARRRVRAPAADVAGVLHAHPLGEVQSRIAYDIGGIDDVVTSTATSTVSTVATVAATVVGDVRAELGADALLAGPAAVLRVADAPRRQRAPAHPVGAPEPPGGHVDAGRGVALGVGDPARQDDGPLAGAGATASPTSPASSPTSRSGPAWPAAGGWRQCR